MIHTVMSFAFIIIITAVAFGLTALIVVTIANAKAARRKQESRRELPPHVSDSAKFKRGI
ncbi:MAG: hypothetical protein KAJ19_21215 [Gammaproteobacteria bacterium]|nr:hypothetical protein [Gammaproteobacteria bacterium]